MALTWLQITDKIVDSSGNVSWMDAKLSSLSLVLVVYINLDGCPIGKFVELSILPSFWLSHRRDHGRVLTFQ